MASLQAEQIGRGQQHAVGVDRESVRAQAVLDTRVTSPEHVENHDRDANRDRRIGDVERPEVMRPPVDVDEIDHRAGDDPVEEVAGGAADDQRQADACHQLMMRQARRVQPDADERGRRDRWR